MRPLAIRLVLLLALCAAACARTAPPPADSGEPAARPVEDPRPAAQAAADKWLELVDRAMYDVSWDSAAASFRRAVTKNQWRNALLETRMPFEPVGERRIIESRYTTSMPNAPTGNYVIIRYETWVAGGRKATETVIPMRDADGQWRVSGYVIRPR
jgi:uncharacterized protein DUF4019